MVENLSTRHVVGKDSEWSDLLLVHATLARRRVLGHTQKAAAGRVMVEPHEGVELRRRIRRGKQYCTHCAIIK